MSPAKKLDLHAVDYSGCSVLHHLAELAPGMTYDNAEMARHLLALGADAGVAAWDGRTPLEAAADAGAWRVARALAAHAGAEAPRRSESVPPTSLLSSDDWEDEFPYDVGADAKEMLRQLELEAERKRRKDGRVKARRYQHSYTCVELDYSKLF